MGNFVVVPLLHSVIYSQYILLQHVSAASYGHDDSKVAEWCCKQNIMNIYIYIYTYIHTHTHTHTGLFISPSGISEIDCATTKTDTAERSISIGTESLQVFFVLGALAFDIFRENFFRVPSCPHFAPSMPPCSLVLGPSIDTPTPLCEP